MFPTFSFQESIECSKGLSGVKRILWWAGIAAALSNVHVRGVEPANVTGLVRSESSFVVTNVAQFRSVPPELFLDRCSFQLNGVVTLVDSNRDLLVLQDDTGAVALNPKAGVRSLKVEAGQRISVEASRCSPYVVGFPKFPYLPSSSEVWPSLEGPAHFGSYYLTRMRGFLRPPATGDYTFWIASDNSSELWLSATDELTKIKRIAFISRYGWVAPREWTHYPSQRSENIYLEAGKAYYIEALQEQANGDDHLAVAWQGPSVRQSVIANQYLTPWIESENRVLTDATNGILREYWTNFSMGTLAPLAGPRTFASILSVDDLRVTMRSAEAQPRPLAIAIDEQLRPEDDYHWVEAQGEVTFCGRDEGGGFLELSDGDAQIQVRVLRSDPDSMRRFQNATVRVAGVCEGVYDQKGVLVPGLIWAAQENSISLVDRGKAATAAITGGQSSHLVLTNSNPAMMGFYNTRGVVTFNDRVFGNDVMFVQEETAAIFVSLKDRNFGNQFAVGRWVELGGAFQPGKNIPVLSPLTIMELGWRSMPTPMTQPMQFPVPGARDGRWTEIEGVVHAVNANGTLMLMGSGGPLSVWIGKTSSEALSQYVDATLRVRGVLSLTMQEAPLLLAPSTAFADVEQEAPKNPFSMPVRPVSGLVASEAEAAQPHRVRLAGKVTLGGRRFFFMQDDSGGVRVQLLEHRDMQVGESVEVLGFPSVNGSIRTLTEALARPAGDNRVVAPQKLNAGEGISFKNAGTLVEISANLVAQRLKAGGQVLELQEKQRVFEAELPVGQPELPAFAPGSRLQLSGVCDFEAVASSAAGNVAAESPSSGALKIWLRTPADVVLLNGPPWFNWKYTVGLVGALLTVLVVSLLRIHLLRRRLERHLAFSRQILESQESERHRIAANLHDSLGQNLLVIKNQARLAMQPAADESVLRHRLDEISDCALQAINEVREITHALRPYQLDRLGLAQTIRATVSRAAENSPILFASHVDEVDRVFDKEAEIHVYRLVQEGVNNIVKHSAATEAAVVVKKVFSAVSLSIRDNGKGFDAAAMEHFVSPEDVGHGLNGIKERVRILGGTLVIDSRPGQGTSLSIEIPLSAHETK
jgi:signal transduction histidine kinase